MAVTAFKGNVTIAGGTFGTIGLVRSLSINETQGTVDTTATDTSTGRTHLGTWNDGTFTCSGVFDPDDVSQKLLDTSVSSGAAETVTITFRSGDTWAASCICTEFGVSGDYEGVLEFTGSWQKSGDATWTAGA